MPGLPIDVNPMVRPVLAQQLRTKWAQNVTTATAGLVHFYTSVALNDAIAAASEGAAEILQQLADNLSAIIRSRRGGFTSALETVGAEAQRVMLERFEETAKGTGPYRVDAAGKYHRDAGGRLLSVLEDPEFFRAASDGLSFGDRALLDAASRGWRRQEVGAGAGAGAESASVSIFGVDSATAIGRLGGQAGPIYVPAGFWTSANEFYPYGYVKARHMITQIRQMRSQGEAWYVPERTVNVPGRHFIQAGIDYIAENVGAAVMEVFAQILRDGLNGKGIAAQRRIIVSDLPGFGPIG